MTADVLCVDANFVLRLLVLEPPSPYRDLWEQWQKSGVTIAAPTLFYYELSNALNRMSVVGQVLPERASEALEIAFNLDITLYGDVELHRRGL